MGSQVIKKPNAIRASLVTKKKDSEMINVLTATVLKKDGIDDLFEDHYASGEEDKPFGGLITDAVKIVHPGDENADK